MEEKKYLNLESDKVKNEIFSDFTITDNLLSYRKIYVC